MMRWVRDLASVLPVAVAASAVLAAGEGAGHALFERRGITKEEAPGDDADSIKAAASARGECCIAAFLFASMLD